MKMKRVLSVGLVGAMALSTLALTGCGSNSSDGGDNTVSWWITMTDGNGVYYDDYEDNPAVEWLNQQYWDIENGGLGTKEDGTPLKFTFQVPISGSETDNFNTMMSTGEYTDIIDLAMSTDTAATMVDEGTLLDITDYVEKYMPHYIEYLDKNPEQKALLTHEDENGDTRYYEIGAIKEENDVPWGGYMYRRDWLVEYAQPTAYVWDWDSDYVKENGHPAVTPLEEAQASGNMEGWKANEVTEFTSSEGEDPKNDYTDNVIFPSGTSDPLTISDWEWMLDAFKKAIDDKGFSGNTDAYCTTVYYPGFFGMGDLVSSFGGGTGVWSKDADQNVYFSGTSDNFKTYLECLNTWYNNGWMDTRFETRASDMFFSINQTGTAQGQVGLFYGTAASLGDAIRVTCADSEDQQKAYVMPCAVPINDKYGTDEQKYKEPDAFYQGSRIAGRIGITEALEDKSEDTIAALFTFLDWMYTREGALTRSVGLSQEQIDSVDLENNLYEEYGIEGGAYDVSENEDGKTVYTFHYDTSGDLGNALKFTRMVVGAELTGAGADIDYVFDKGESKVHQLATEQWTKYTSTASLYDYNNQFTTEQNDIYSDINQSVNDYMNQNTPNLIKNGLDGWDAYVEGINALHPEELTEVYQEVMDSLFG
ncbi:MAG: hypothetical protein ACLRS1_01765 [Oscillospiraceae bacterium]